MTLKAISIAPNNYQNPVELDRVMVDMLAQKTPGVLYEDPALPELKCAPGAGHTIDVAVGKAYIREKVNPVVRGGYLFHNDAVLNIAMPVPQSQPFIATVIALVADPQYGAVTGAVGPRLDIISGAPASGPVATTDAAIDAIAGTPGGWIRLCDVRINTADTGAIPVGQFVDVRPFTTLGGSRQSDTQVFTATGTWTKPKWAKFVRVRLVGGGGGGGGGTGAGSGQAQGAGGGGGGYVEHVFIASALSATEVVTVGTGGAASGAVGAAGVSSAFKTTLIASGGAGGQSGGTAGGTSSGGTAGAGGAAAGGNVVSVPGGDGGSGRTILGVSTLGAFGGASQLAPQVQQSFSSAADGPNGSRYGGGGAGGFVSTAGRNGGLGAAGIVIIESW